MVAKKNPENSNVVEIDISKPVDARTGGAIDQGNVLTCDFDPVDLADPSDLDWKPYLALNCEISVGKLVDGRVMVFARRRMA